MINGGNHEPIISFYQAVSVKVVHVTGGEIDEEMETRSTIFDDRRNDWRSVIGERAAKDGRKVYAGDHAQSGSAWFKDGDLTSYDHVYLCDHAEDNHSVAVHLLYKRRDGRRMNEWRWNWWGPYKYNGCKDLKLDVHPHTTMFYKVCLGDYGHPGGKKAKVIKSSCSDRAKAEVDE